MSKRLLKFTLPILLIAGFLWVMQGEEPLSIGTLYLAVEQAGFWAEFYFIGLYCLAVLLFLPTPMFTLTGGALFGPWGILYNLFAVTLGATLSFLLTRYIGSDWLYRSQNKRLQQVIQGVDNEGWRFVAIVRLLPFMPFDVLNYALGMTRIGFLPYVVTTAISLIPATTAYSLIGHLGGAAMQGEADLWNMGIAAILLVLLVGYLPRLLGLLGVGFNIREHHHHLRKGE